MNIKEVNSTEELLHIKGLFIEYVNSLGIDLSFQNFNDELSSLPGEYSSPDGALLLAEFDGKIAGCIALRKISDKICEMKRLYVRDEYKGKRIGYALIKQIIDKAKNIGYRYMRLDTLPSMKKAICLYRSLGFVNIDPYRYNPVEGAMFMELDLKS